MKEIHPLSYYEEQARIELLDREKATNRAGVPALYWLGIGLFIFGMYLLATAGDNAWEMRFGIVTAIAGAVLAMNTREGTS